MFAPIDNKIISIQPLTNNVKVFAVWYNDYNCKNVEDIKIFKKKMNFVALVEYYDETYGKIRDWTFADADRYGFTGFPMDDGNFLGFEFNDEIVDWEKEYKDKMDIKNRHKKKVTVE